MTKISNQYSLTNILTADLANSRLGINNVSPTVALDVTGAGKFSGNVVLSGSDSRFNGGDSVGRLILSNSNTTTYIALYGATHPTLPYIFSLVVNSSSALAIASTGRATFESTNAKVNTGQWHLSVQDNTSMAAGVGGGISFNGYKTGTTAQGLYAAIDGYKENATAGNELGGFRIWTSNGTNLVERMRITSAGNVGIGTSSPNDYSLGSSAKVLQVTGSGYGIMQVNANTVTAWLIADTGEAAVGTSSNHPFKVTTNNTERMRITSGGRILMGGTSDNGSSTLQVWHPTGGAGLLLRSGADLVLEPASLPNNNAGFYNDYGSLQAFVGGSTGAYCNGTTWVNGSDIKLKKDINTITFNGLDAISLLRPVSYKFISDEKEKERIGFIAQEIQEVLPQVVDDSSGEHLGVDYGSITAALVKAIQELSAKVSLLENK